MTFPGSLGARILPFCLVGAVLGCLTTAAPAQTTVKAAAENPAQLRTVKAEELWRVGGFGEGESDFFGYVSDVVRNSEGLTFLLDRQLNEVKAYDTDGNYLYKFGREGEGPGEFQNPQSMLLLPDGTIGVLQGRPQRFERFSPEGEILDPLSLSGGEFMAFTMGAASVGGRVVLNRRAIRMEDDDIITKAELVALADDGSEGVVYLQQETSRPRTGPGISITVDSSFAEAWALGYDGRVHVSNHEDLYRIDTYDPSGEMVRVIERPYERRKRPAEELASMKEQAEKARGDRPGNDPIEIEQYDRDISDILARPNGDLWVMDSHGSPHHSDDTLGTFVVFDAAGQMTHRLRIDVPYRPGKDRFYVIGDHLYVVQEAISAMRNMYAGFGSVVIDGEDDSSDGEPDPLAVVCYRLPGLDG